MLSVHKILLPLVFTETSRHVVDQAAWLARLFHAEIVLLHVVTPFEYPAGLLESGDQITARDLQAKIIQRAQQDLDQALPLELEGMQVTRLLLRGDPVREILKTAREQNVDMVVMASHGHGGFYRFVLGSVTSKVLQESHCPVWTGAHLEEAPVRPFSMSNVLCSVDLKNPHSAHTASLAAQMATAAGARLTLIHITASVEVFGPGGPHVDTEWQEKIVGFANKEMAKLQGEIGTQAEVIIDSGHVTELLNRAAEQIHADVLVIGHAPGRGHLGDNGNGYEIIRESQIPVLSV